jgi:hypothetical protein
MNRILITFFAFQVILGCKQEKMPQGVLSQPEMVNVLIQLYVAEERLSKVAVPYDSSTKLIPYFRVKVFESTGVPDSVYKKSMEYYMANPKKLELIYTALVDSLSLKEQSKPNENAP